MSVDLSVSLGRLRLPNPVLVASGTFGYARELEGVIDFAKLGGIIPKTVTAAPRMGNPPPRTVETPSGLLNSIGLDNDGIDYFIEHHLPYLTELGTPIIANIAGKSKTEFIEMASKIGEQPGLAAVELNISCPNVAGGIDFATNPFDTEEIIAGCRKVCPYPLIAKLTPMVSKIEIMVEAAKIGGADAVSLCNTFPAMALNWRRAKPILGNGMGGLSGPAIKPMVLRLVWLAAQANLLPIIAVGGIATIDDVMEFLVAGASAVQIGTATFYDPTASIKIIHELPQAIGLLNQSSVRDVIGLAHRK